MRGKEITGGETTAGCALVATASCVAGVGLVLLRGIHVGQVVVTAVVKNAMKAASLAAASG